MPAFGNPPVTVQTCGDLPTIGPIVEGQPSTVFPLQTVSVPSNVNSYTRLRPIHLTKSELLHFQDVIDNRAWFAGSPEDAVTYLEELQDKYPGLEQVMIAFPMGATTTQFREQMGRFAAEVIPHFKKETAASA